MSILALCSVASESGSYVREFLIYSSSIQMPSQVLMD